MKKISFLALSLVMMTALAQGAIGGGSAAEPSAKRSQKRSHEAKAMQALRAIIGGYEGRNLDGFMKHVDDGAYGNAGQLRSDVGQRFNEFGQADLKITQDQALVEGDKVALKTHWQKRSFATKSGEPVLTTGIATFVFIVGEDARLIDIQGSSPF